LILSHRLTLYTPPVIYLILDRLRLRIRGSGGDITELAAQAGTI
jgi:hypothetical protein